jgi:hypothetical protein
LSIDGRYRRVDRSLKAKLHSVPIKVFPRTFATPTRPPGEKARRSEGAHSADGLENRRERPQTNRQEL